MDVATVATRDEVVSFIVENYLFGDSSRLPADDESLLGAGVIDSTGVLELIEFLESDLGITVADVETVPENLDTIANLTRFVARKRPALQATDARGSR